LNPEATNPSDGNRHRLTENFGGNATGFQSVGAITDAVVSNTYT
jgi:hypothetical protein